MFIAIYSHNTVRHNAYKKDMKIKKIYILLLFGLTFAISACSIKSLQRVGYETLQNIQKQQCDKELSSDCPKQKTYNRYQRQIKDRHADAQVPPNTAQGNSANR